MLEIRRQAVRGIFVLKEFTVHLPFASIFVLFISFHLL
jgi:hypothetical protein